MEYKVCVPIPESLKSAELLSQGAEALVFTLDNEIVKFRPTKQWRLPELDALLRKKRTNQESRTLLKLMDSGISVPKVLKTDANNGLITMEKISGKSLKQATWDSDVNYVDLYKQLGEAVAEMHNLNIVHGDLTTSNVMVRGGGVVIIDFGLSTRAASAEDKAVDLYVLERAIQSTHPLESAGLVHEVLSAYEARASKLNPSHKEQVMSRLKNTRQRGRKRTQLG